MLGDWTNQSILRLPSDNETTLRLPSDNESTFQPPFGNLSTIQPPLWIHPSRRITLIRAIHPSATLFWSTLLKYLTFRGWSTHKNGGPPFRVDVTTIFKGGFVSPITQPHLNKGGSSLLKAGLKVEKGGPPFTDGCRFPKNTLHFSRIFCQKGCPLAKLIRFFSDPIISF